MNSAAPISQLLERLMDPTFYDHEVSEPIQCLETHSAYVLLTGSYAYKLKKAVDFGFLNFSTLAARRFYCEEEYRLNQRGAPDLYLGVIEFTKDPTGIYLNGPGECIEVAVKMRQFPQQCLFSALLKRDELTDALMRQLGQRVAQFHREAATDPFIREFGTIDSIRAAFEENYQQTKIYSDGPQTQQQWVETKAFTDHVFQSDQRLFEQRVEQHRIRECHGDLHLRNICWWEDRILLFDCIEFNPSFRNVDVMYDVAFTVMDLDANGRSDLATVYLNTYLEETGDWEGLVLLPLYLSRQAYVRAKVTSFRLAEPFQSVAEHAEIEHTAAQYYQLAWRYTRPKQGRLLLMAGLSGSGKSTVARQLAQILNAIHIRSDAVRKQLGSVALYEKGGPDLYSLEMSEKTYARLIDLGEKLTQRGYTVILDGTFSRKAGRQRILDWGQRVGIPVQMIYCTAPLSVLQERIRQRLAHEQDISDATPELIGHQHTAWDSFTEDEWEQVITVDTDQVWDPEEIVAVILGSSGLGG